MKNMSTGSTPENFDDPDSRLPDTSVAGNVAPVPQKCADAQPANLNPFTDLASLNLGASYVDDGIKVKRKLLTMPMGSPDKRQFFRAIREGKAFIARIYERPVPGELRPTPYFVDLWAISVGQRDNAWSRTGLEIVAAAEERYVRCVPNGRDGYAIEYPEQDLGEPSWPELSQSEWYDLAFKGRVIDSFDHEVLRELRGAG